MSSSTRDGVSSRSPFTVNSTALNAQLGSLSLAGQPGGPPRKPSSSMLTANVNKPQLNRHGKSSSGSSSHTNVAAAGSNARVASSAAIGSKNSSSLRPDAPPRSPPPAGRADKHGGARSVHGSPTKQQPRESTSKAPSRSSVHGRVSVANGAGRQASSVVAAGGLGRMDIVAQDWDALTGSNTSPQKKKPTNSKRYDRFIPSRENSSNNGSIAETGHSHSRHASPDDTFEEGESRGSEADAALGDGFDDSPPPTPHGRPSAGESSDQAHTAELSNSLGIELGKRILSFSAEPPPASNEHSSLLAAYARGDAGVGRNSAHSTALAASHRRRIATTPERVLDAPGLVDDYYLNLLDWSSTNLVAIALSESVYIWNAETGDVGCLCSVNTGANGEDITEEIVCSVRFSEDGSYLAVGTSSGPIQIYDLSSSTRVRTMAGHATRVPTLSWSGAILSSGSRDGSIWNSDVRIANHKTGEMRGHRAEVCGLEWRKDSGLAGSAGGSSSGGGMGLLASGGNDNVVNVWDGRMLSAPKVVKTNHTAAVKAIAWCPWQSSLLATGGGSSDRTINFWNTTTSARLNSLVTPSQVTSLVFNPHSREILSSHGFPDNQLSIWTFPTLSKVVDITQAHETRVLHSCLSPDGTTLATASSDENLKFWKVFDLPKKTSSSSGLAGSFAGKSEPKSGDEMGRRGRTGIAIR